MICLEFIQTNFLCAQFSLPLYSPTCALEVFPQDLGYEIDEDELANEIPAPVPAPFTGQMTADVDPQEFEAIYGWFLS